jgi:hypothetical protein
VNGEASLIVFVGFYQSKRKKRTLLQSPSLSEANVQEKGKGNVFLYF